MDNKALAERLSDFMIAQNNAILDCLAHPEKYKPKHGYGEDPWGQPVYVDDEWTVHHIYNPYKRNGWTC